MRWFSDAFWTFSISVVFWQIRHYKGKLLTMTPSYAIASLNRSYSVLNRFVCRQMGLLLGVGAGNGQLTWADFSWPTRFTLLRFPKLGAILATVGWSRAGTIPYSRSQSTTAGFGAFCPGGPRAVLSIDWRDLKQRRVSVSSVWKVEWSRSYLYLSFQSEITKPEQWWLARVLTVNKRVYKVSVFLSHTWFITAAAPLKVVSNTTHPRLWRRFLCEGVLYTVTGKRFIGVVSWPAFPITLYTEVSVIVASGGLCTPNIIEKKDDKVTLL